MNILKSVFRAAKESRTNSDQYRDLLAEKALVKERKDAIKEINKAISGGEISAGIYLTCSGRVLDKVYSTLRDELAQQGYQVSRTSPIGYGITKFTVSW